MGFIQIWLVWQDAAQGDQLVGIASTELEAIRMKKLIIENANFFDQPRPTVIIEPRELNHMYGYDMNRQSMREILKGVRKALD